MAPPTRPLSRVVPSAPRSPRAPTSIDDNYEDDNGLDKAVVTDTGTKKTGTEKYPLTIGDSDGDTVSIGDTNIIDWDSSKMTCIMDHDDFLWEISEQDADRIDKLIVDEEHDIRVDKGNVLRKENLRSDEVMVAYFIFLEKRNARRRKLDEKYPSFRYVGSHFFSKMCKGEETGGNNYSYDNFEYEYELVEKWWKRVHPAGIFEVDKLVFIANPNRNHWILIVVEPKKGNIWHYDSNCIGADTVLRDRLVGAVYQYVADEYRRTKKAEPIAGNWVKVICNPAKTPQQDNGYDCGVFVCMYGDCIERGIEMTFCQGDVPGFRTRIGMTVMNPLI